MRTSGDEHGADIDDGGLQVDDRRLVDPVVDAERTRHRIDFPSLRWPRENGLAVRVERVGPERLRAHAVLVPALERAAAARAVVVFAAPLVVALRELVEHPRAHPLEALLRSGVAMAEPEEVVH